MPRDSVVRVRNNCTAHSVFDFGYRSVYTELRYFRGAEGAGVVVPAKPFVAGARTSSPTGCESFSNKVTCDDTCSVTRTFGDIPSVQFGHLTPSYPGDRHGVDASSTTTGGAVTGVSVLEK